MIRRNRGFSYVELLLAVILLAIVLVPLIQSLINSISAQNQIEKLLQEHLYLKGKLEETLAEPYTELTNEVVLINNPDTLTSYSDPAGSASRRLVYLFHYDVDNADGDDDPFTGTESTVIWVKTTSEETKQSIEALRFQHE